ncbi:kinase-like domain-containing protein [Aspergillus foveolatus]|uniref:kinase-like domain-containing protein n=1 Tax=Aspergillus foveolatus TaxID=210207 RepID=UPI003CCD83DC
MATSDDSSARCLYEPLEEVEKIENYRPEGYHPIQIGDHFHGRYRVVHKLGYDTYSMTWLAPDSNPKEADIISSLTRPHRSTGHSLGKAMVPSILGRHTIHGPNGEHACYVTAPARARFVHGDLHLGNILLKIPPSFDHLSPEQLYEEYAEPELEPVHSPRYPSSQAWFEPESPLSFQSDKWSLACTIWSIFAQRPLFEGFLATEDDMTCEHVDALGILPPEWWNRWEARRHKFTEDGKPINRNPYRSWEDRFEDSVQQPRRDSGMPPVDARERAAIFDMLQPMLSFRPENRPTAKQVLESEWMVKWALPEYGKIRSHV